MNSKRKLIYLALVVITAGCSSSGEKKAPLLIAQPSPAAQTPQTQAAVAPGTAAEETNPVTESPMSADDSPAPLAPSEPEAAPVQAAPEKTVAPPSPAPAAVAPQALAPLPAPKSVASKPAASKPMAPRGPVTVVADRTPRTFQLVAETKDASHPYFGRGSDMGFVTDGVPGKELVLTRGVTYTFSLDTGVMHDFYFTTSPVGRGAGTLTEGITGQFIFKGDAIFTPTANTPAVVYYECRNHAYMGGKIHVVNAGEKVTVGLATESLAEEAPAPVRNYTAAQVKQKLGFADMVIGSSASAKRVAASDNAEAKGLMAQAREQLTSARSALSGADNNRAMESVNEALRLMNNATRLVPDHVVVDYKSRYTELLDQIHGFETAYQKNIANGVKEKAGEELNKARFSGLMSEAQSFAGQGEHEGAVRRLESANEMITAALSAMLQSQTVVYDKTFATAKDEFDFELSRYNSYVELVPVAIEQRQPSPQTVALMDQQTERAREIHDEAMGLAKKGDHKMAVMALQAATEKVQRALRLAGVQ